MNPNQLENRLIDFAIAVINACKFIDQSFAAQHLSKQLIRSSTAVALNYGEARSAESNRDFLHKMKIAFMGMKLPALSQNGPIKLVVQIFGGQSFFLGPTYISILIQ